MPEILITGASGFIGRHLSERLSRDGTDFAILDRSQGDIGEAATWANAPPCGAVVHLAGRSFVPDSWTDPAGFLRTNLCGTAQALEYCRRHGARLVFISTYLYGRQARLPVSESASLEATNPYALSKKLGEEACAFFARVYGLDVSVLRLFNVYGPGQPGHFLIPEIVAQVIGGKEISLKDLAPRRDYVAVADVVDAILRAASGPAGLGVFNIGSGVSHSVGEVVALIQELAGTALPVRDAGERRPEEVMDAVADNTAARRDLGWEPRFDLRAGLAAMLKHAGIGPPAGPRG